MRSKVRAGVLYLQRERFLSGLVLLSAEVGINGRALQR